LIVILFAAVPLGLVGDYSTSCFKYSTVGGTKTCTEWNPFYSNNLYVDQIELDWWNATGLNVNDFNKDALVKFNCQQSDALSVNVTINCNDPTEALKVWPEDLTKVITPEMQDLGSTTQKLLHFTFVFQIFVFMQIFNQINARKIEDGEFNVFSGIFSNYFFLVVIVLVTIIQIAMVEYGGKAIKTYPLNTNENIICISIAASELVWGFILKFLPLGLFQWVSLDDSP